MMQINKDKCPVEIQSQTSATSSDVSQREAADVGSHDLKLIFFLSRFYSWSSRIFYLLPLICRITESHPICLLISILIFLFSFRLALSVW